MIRPENTSRIVLPLLELTKQTQQKQTQHSKSKQEAPNQIRLTMLAPEVEDPKAPKEVKKEEKPAYLKGEKEWKPFLVVDHNMRPQGYFNETH
jgi:hypothetical protein